MRVLGFGTYDTARHPRVGIILDGMRDAGDQVVEANAPLGFSTAERVEMLKRPWLALHLASELLHRWVRIGRRGRTFAQEEVVDAVVVGYLGQFDVVLARVLFPKTTIVLDLLVFAADTARDRGTTSPLVLWPLRRLDRVAAACADVIVVDTEEHIQLLAPRHRIKGVVVPVGAPLAWSGPRSSRAPGGPLRAVFFGLYTPLQGATVIGGALAALADRSDIEVTMIGQGQDLAETRRLAGPNPRVTWLDWVDPSRLPAAVRAFDVCLGIFGTTAKATRVVPNKVFQGAAAGCAIVTSDTAPQRRLLGTHARYVPRGDATALAKALEELSDDRGLLDRLQREATALATATFTPAAVVGPLRHRLQQRTDRTGDGMQRPAEADH